LHTHTQLSDGEETVEGVTDIARGMGLDFFALTDHNVIHTGRRGGGPFILPGVEVTSMVGHFNILGLKREPPLIFSDLSAVKWGARQFTFETEWEQALAIIEDARRLGSAVCLNHPFGGVYGWEFADAPISAFDAVEIINGPSHPMLREANERALSLWSAMWTAGLQICGVGGSDFHKAVHRLEDGSELTFTVGDPVTRVYCPGLSAANILKAIKDRCVYVTRRADITPEIYRAGGLRVTPGSQIIWNGGEPTLTFVFAAPGNPSGLSVSLVCADGILEEREFKAYSGEITLTVSIADTSSYGWIRADFRDRGELAGFINPVYWNPPPQPALTFGDIEYGKKS
jgi:hypothetical protein